MNKISRRKRRQKWMIGIIIRVTVEHWLNSFISLRNS